MAVCGHGKEYWSSICPKSYIGMVESGKNILSDKIAAAGVALVIHSRLVAKAPDSASASLKFQGKKSGEESFRNNPSNDHFKENITTARIFEALAASNVIICDRLPFIVENFDDSVLYIDRDLPPEQMFKQIDGHTEWILSHQKEAIEMARRAHQIFVEKFSLEKILQNVIDFYRAHKDDKKKAGK